MPRPAFKIESHVPYPKKEKRPKYPFEQLKIGESFCFPKTIYKRVSVMQALIAKKTGRTFSCRKETPKRVRCWRLK